MALAAPGRLAPMRKWEKHSCLALQTRKNKTKNDKEDTENSSRAACNKEKRASNYIGCFRAPQMLSQLDSGVLICAICHNFLLVTLIHKLHVTFHDNAFAGKLNFGAFYLHGLAIYQ